MKKRSNVAVCRKLIVLVRPLTGFMLAAILMGLAGHLAATFLTILGGYAILDAVGSYAGVGMKTALIVAGLLAFFRGILRYAEQACNHYIAFRLLALIRSKVFAALRRLCPAKLEGRDKGNLISVITSDIELLEVFYAHTISPVAIAFLMTIVMTCYIGHFAWQLGILALLAYLLVGIAIPLFISKQSKNDGMQLRTLAGELSSFVLDSLRGLPEILQYRQGEKRLEEMNRRTDRLMEQEAHLKSVAGKNTGLTGAVILLSDTVMLLAAGLMCKNGTLDFSFALLAVIALMSSFGPVTALANLGSTLQNTFAAGNRVLDILEEEPVIEEVAGRQPTPSFEGAKAEHVDFSYEKEPILSDFSMEIPKNQIIGVIGKSGSGKSTFLKLLMRFWQTDAGTIQISGKSIDTVNTTDLRRMESYMTQETQLFHDSITNNVRVAKPDASMEEIENACKKASIHDFILSLPKGYETAVGELGDTLSGGERQRIGLARAFLHDADLMLLDEPTSNLDSLNEGVILKALKEEQKDKTVVLVSHRESTMRIADCVCSVENGRMS